MDPLSDVICSAIIEDNPIHVLLAILKADSHNLYLPHVAVVEGCSKEN